MFFLHKIILIFKSGIPVDRSNPFKFKNLVSLLVIVKIHASVGLVFCLFNQIWGIFVISLNRLSTQNVEAEAKADRWYTKN